VSLCKRGLIERRVFRDGRRRYGLFITPAGTRCLDEVSRVHDEHQAELLGAFDEQEQEVLGSLLGRLAQGTSARRTDASRRN
jgi:DNA-binding MarR family transcriptional regulator